MKRVFSVGQVNLYIKNLFYADSTLHQIYIKGEVSNCKYHSSGHIYFTLKDATGQMACVMFAGQRKGLQFRLEEGQSVIAFGSINVYERDGKYQLYADEIVLDGQGILYEKFEQLKKKLSAEGLFSSEHKKAIPRYPKSIGIVTASTGAAIQDIINISTRRNPYVKLILYPATVQGEGAASTIVRGIKALDSYGVDTIIVGRGGGSIEDLWAFNEEEVARAIFECDTPIISAVGHETDTTIADYVSDLRAPTPSAAAELAVNDYQAIIEALQRYEMRLANPLLQKLRLYKARMNEIKIRLDYASPTYKIRQKRQNLMDMEQILKDRLQHKLLKKRHELELYISKLEGLSPLTKLKQGYALVTKPETNKAVKSVKDVGMDENLNISLVDGVVECMVTNKIEMKKLRYSSKK